MKRVQLFARVSAFEDFVNRTDIEILKVDVKAVEQSYHFQEGFSAVVFYRELSSGGSRSIAESKEYADTAVQAYYGEG